MANPQSRPWQGRTSEGALGDAGPYSAAQWSFMYKHLLGTGAEKADRGVIRGVLSELVVSANSPTASNVVVSGGAGLVQGKWFYNDISGETISINANASGSTRIDVIVLQADYTAQTVRLAVVQGTPGAGYPSLTQSLVTIWQIPLAYITLTSGFTSITASMITDQRNYANIPANIGIDVTNSSGSTRDIGDLVIWSTGQTITTSTGGVTTMPAGVIEARSTAGASARIITQGIYPVRCQASVSAGDMLQVGTTAGQAISSHVFFGFARVLVANTGAGTNALCYINVQAPPIRPACVVTHSVNQTVANGATSALAFNTERFDNDTMHDTVTNNSRITIRRAGLYYVFANMDLTTNFSGAAAQIRLNGATKIQTLEAAQNSNVSNGKGSRLYLFAANDYIEVVLANGSGGTLTINANSAWSPEFGVAMITPV